MNTVHTRATSLLDTWIANGELRSRVEISQDLLRRPMRPDWNWYTKARDERGVEAAEAELKATTVERQLHEVGTAFEPVARGMLALSKVKPESRSGEDYVQVIDDPSSIEFPGLHRFSSIGKMVVVLNPEIPGCGCNQPQGSYVFGESGMLGLKAVTLCVDPGSPENNQLSLVLPSHRKGADPSAYAVARFTLDGAIWGHEISPQLYVDGPLRAHLGLSLATSAWCFSSMSGGDPDSIFGLGGTDYIRKNLSKLGEYFTGIAEKLNSEHKH